MYKYFMPDNFNDSVKVPPEAAGHDMRKISRIIRMDDSIVHTRVEYPFGLHIETKVYASGVEVLSSWPIVELYDGSLGFVKPYPETK